LICISEDDVTTTAGKVAELEAVAASAFVSDWARAGAGTRKLEQYTAATDASERGRALKRADIRNKSEVERSGCRIPETV
jgi:phage FluMu protein gp41